ncbi:TolC family protein [Lignipirellula cremea]|uniref:Outer membrane efflux protein n=1 Tax=Lignipirellula cremea TaxID=2528010 RepID=A0A518E312_9BACT|nr:TolC family protein [Lignipirellula cremea]QDU98471.1 Outer membrane efflux protein [Lignipirellula cremea]
MRTVSHEPSQLPAEPVSGVLTVDGRNYKVQLVEEVPPPSHAGPNAAGQVTRNGEPVRLPVASPSGAEYGPPAMPEAIELNLPTALSMVGGQHPAVGFAQWRVQEAYARFDRAKVLWLPSIQPGFSFDQHDGNYQASDGSIVDVNRNSFQYGLGTGATGAGTTPNPGIVARFHLADAIFQPAIAQKTAWARGHAADGVLNQQLLTVAVAYLDLLDAVQDLKIIEETQQHTAAIAQLTSDFAATGQGLQADADRLATERMLVDNRYASARERAEIASSRLAQALSIDASQPIAPLDLTVLPLDMAPVAWDRPELIRTGLVNRPELKEAQSLVAAACEEYRRQQYSPFIPSVLLGFSNGGFGGGLGDSISNVDSRYDFDAVLTWEIRNLGFGEGAARRESNALVEQAKFAKLRILDQVAREVAEAHAQVTHRAVRISITEQAIRSAQDSYDRNLRRIRDGQGLPLEVLQSIRALEDARRAYLNAVIEYNQAQFRLQWALGWPVVANG